MKTFLFILKSLIDAGGRVALLALTLTLGRVAEGQPTAVTNLFVMTNSVNNGSSPYGNLIFGAGGTLYGVTYVGGAHGYGTVYKINQDGTGFMVLHAFTDAETGDNNNFTVLSASNPLPLIQGADGVLYGASTMGGTNGNGMLFRLNPDGSGYAIIHSFNSADGSPWSLIQGSDGGLYGAGFALFRINTDGSGYQVLHTFNQSAEGIITYGLCQGSGGQLYGTLLAEGANNYGAIFTAATNGGNFAILHSFPAFATDAEYPVSITQGSDGLLYGISTAYGSANFGTVFGLATDGSSYQVLHQFANTNGDGAYPYCKLLQSGAFLYGTTYGGGSLSIGSIFKIGLGGTNYGVVYSFNENSLSSPTHPLGGLALGSASAGTGILYGTTANNDGGVGGDAGAVYAMLLNPPATITPLSGGAVNGQSVIVWPSWAYGYTLQATTNLASTNWVTVSNAIPIVGVQVTNNQPGTYYRLVWP